MGRDESFLERMERRSIGWHDTVNLVAKGLYHKIRPPHDSPDWETARANMHDLASKLGGRSLAPSRDPESDEHFAMEDEQVLLSHQHRTGRNPGKITRRGRRPASVQILDGSTYVMRHMVTGDEQTLWDAALGFDRRGFLPLPHESLADLAYRANTVIFLHSKLRENWQEPIIRVGKDLEAKITLGYGAHIIPREDVIEANKRIPYQMDLTWMTGFVKEKLPMGVLGLCYTLPNYNNFSFLNMRRHYKNREQYLSTLAHEMTHMGTAYLDSMHDFTETKAYSVGSGRLGEFVVAMNAHPNIIGWTAEHVLDRILPMPVGEHAVKYITKALSAIEIADHNMMFRGLGKKLRALYGDDGDYLLGRLTADEIGELMYTNDIPARIAAKDSVKWRIMKAHLD